MTTSTDTATPTEPFVKPLFNMELFPEDIEVFAFVRRGYKNPKEAGRQLSKADTIRRAMKKEAVRMGYKLRV